MAFLPIFGVFNNADNATLPAPSSEAAVAVVITGDASLVAPDGESILAVGVTMDGDGEASVPSSEIASAVAMVLTCDAELPAPSSEASATANPLFISGDTELVTPFSEGTFTASPTPPPPPPPPPSFSVGTGDGTLWGPSVVAAGSFYPAFAGSGSGSLMAPFGTGAGTFTPPVFTGSGSPTLMAPTAKGLGLFLLFEFNDLGRQRIDVDQPLGGSTYPFREVSDDVEQLVADFYLSYDDREGSFVRPFNIFYMFGFGVDPSSPPGGAPSPEHTSDIVIKDAVGSVVFDSTTASYYNFSDWNSRLRVHEWRASNAVCRLVSFTAFAPDETPVNYPIHFAPTNAVLHERTLENENQRLLSIFDGLETIEGGTDVELVAGYNVVLEPEEEVREDGGRRVTRINFNVVPGSGAGRAPGCENLVPLVRTLSNVGPDTLGNFFLDSDGCYRIQRPVFVENFVPWQERLVDPRTEYPYESNSNILQIFMECGPCCSCQDFVHTYAGVQRLYTQLAAIATIAQETRDQHKANILRWKAGKACRDNNAFQLNMIKVCGYIASVGFSFCNTTKNCIVGSRMKFTIQAGSIVTPMLPVASGVLCGGVMKQEAFDNNFKNYTPIVNYPNLIFSFGAIPVGTSVRGKFDLAFEAPLLITDPTNVDITAQLLFGESVLATATASLDAMLTQEDCSPCEETP